ncbi:MAG TPA: imidazole glycerol phosphate synthase subunit HisH [Gammaproteobacteria bacterium]|nr:imidazole glycerol phosphate synthase subunit HisH [Gammaproteobacteria bacterium]
MTVAIIDYGMGNLRSVAKAFESVGAANLQVTDDPGVLAAADRLVFPGQGAIGSCFRHLAEHGLDSLLAELLAEKPVLGICLGLQALFDHSEEDGGVDGLGLIPGRVRRFPERMVDAGAAAKIPQMGWNRVGQADDHPLWHGIADNAWFYFVHSYYVEVGNKQHCSGVCRYGEVEFAAAAARENLFAVQFHPEKSHRDGLKLLKNFLDWDGSR